MTEEILDFFVEEANELFDNIHAVLLRAEERGTLNTAELDALFRDYHTLKGGGGSVGFDTFAAYAHILENFLEKLKSKELTATKETMAFLIENSGRLQEIMEREYRHDIDPESLRQETKRLQEAIDTFSRKELPKSPPLLDESAGEITDLFEAIFGLLRESTAHTAERPQLLQELFRNVHTLKGASEFLDVSYFPLYLHDIENLLDRLRAGEIDYDDEVVAFLTARMKRGQKILDDELSGTLDFVRFQEEMESVHAGICRLSGRGKPDFDCLEEGCGAIEEERPEEETFSAPFQLFDEASNAKNPPSPDLPERERKPLPAPSSSPQTEASPSAEQPPVSLKKVAASSSIRVHIHKIDHLMNRVGDLVITKSMLFQFAQSLRYDDTLYKNITDRLTMLDRDIRELQEAVMGVRMIPMETVYARLPKMVRDIAKKLGKEVRFEHSGDSVEIDKMMVEGLMDPLTHIIRNALDHGIEPPQTRIEKGKEPTGALSIAASQESGNIIISVRDDGAGIDTDRVAQKALENGVVTPEELAMMPEEQRQMLIFRPGLSTAQDVSAISGRGVGMDVVMNNIQSLGGEIKIDSRRGIGTEIQLVLPLTLAILDGLNIRIGEREMILPLVKIVESLQPTPSMIKYVGESDKELLMLRSEFIPIIRLHRFFGIPAAHTALHEGMLIVVKSSHTKVALFVDDFLDQEQIVVKSLEKNYRKIDGIGAATIRGDGSIGLILDVMSIIHMHREEERGR